MLQAHIHKGYVSLAAYFLKVKKCVQQRERGGPQQLEDNR
ncbi:hypothetical protein AWRI1631_74730 [Saccharomyces cerevisiae AWRI1631]|uniref:Uncharacterized protein n=1 Tax=Saccharomyces cerevisiae (strain AWRI1631) TaxID=545124 RepID=B5VJJ2_YEAS6|nr:hypothetical protein AWRI1631_74730 [Saccharomyces cerevisiae AWRI1631]